MENLKPNSSIPNFEYTVITRMFRSDQGKVRIDCKTKKEMSDKLYPILKKHLFFCVFDRVGDEACGKSLITRVSLGYHNKGFCEGQIKKVLDRIKIGKITKPSTVEKSHVTIAYWE